MKIPNWNCTEFEAALSDYREGTLRLECAAAARDHLAACAACSELLAAVTDAVAGVQALPQLDPPPALLAAIRAQTSARPGRHGFRLGFGRLWGTVTSPRFALGLAMSVFAFSLLLNAAQINLRQVLSGEALSQLSPASLGSSVQRKLVRTWARGVSYYHDLRVVYEIEAAVHAMRQTPAPAPQPSGHDHSQTTPAGPPDSSLAALPPQARNLQFRRMS